MEGWIPFSDTDCMVIHSVIDSGGRYNLPCCRSGRDLFLRVRLPGTDLWSKPHGIPYYLFMDRTLYRKHKAEDIQWSYTREDDLSVKRGCQIKYQRSWHRNRDIAFFSDYWVVNKSGIALCYETELCTKKRKVMESISRNTSSDDIRDRSYSNDGDSDDTATQTSSAERKTSVHDLKPYEVLRFTQSEFSDDLHRRFVGTSALPLLISCPQRRLRIMPYAMMSEVGQGGFFIYDVHCLSGKLCKTRVNPNVGGKVYCDEPWLITQLPESIAEASRTYRSVYVELHNSDRYSDPQERDFISFRVPKDAFVYLCVDARCKSIPIWMTQLGFLSIGERFHTDNTKTVYQVYKRFYRGLDWVRLGGSRMKAASGSTVNMYAIIIMESPNGYNEPTVASVSVQHMWHLPPTCRRVYQLKPSFHYGDRVYIDTADSVTFLPRLLLSLPLLAVQTLDSDRFVASANLLSIVLQHPTRVFLCVDYCISVRHFPSWIYKRGFNDSGMHIYTANSKYRVLHRSYGVENCVLGGLACRNSDLHNYFVLIADEEEFTRKLSQCPVNSIRIDQNRCRRVKVSEEWTSVPGMCKDDPARDVTQFWGNELGHVTLQRPFFNEQGRHWSQYFDAAVGNKGELQTSCATLAVSIQPLPGVFHRTALVSILPRFVVINQLSVDISVYPFAGTSACHSAPQPSLCTIVDAKVSAVLYSFDREEEESVGHPVRCKRWIRVGSVLTLLGGTTMQQGRTNSAFSRAISVDDVGETHVWLPIRSSVDVDRDGISKHPTDGYLIVNASVTLEDTSVVITLTDRSHFPPYRIENRTSHTVQVRQLLQQKWVEVSRREWCSYLWEDPYGPRSVELSVPASDVVSAPLSLDEIGPIETFHYSRSFFSALMLPSNLQESDGEHVGTSERCAPGIGVNPRPAVGCIAGYVYADEATRVLVLFNYYDSSPGLGRELSMRLHPSPIKAKTMASMRCCSIESEPSIQNLSTFDKVLRSLRVKLSFRGVSINVIADTPMHTLEELLSISVEGILCKFNGNVPSIEYSVYHIQVDDMRPAARFPVILVPADSGFNSHLSDVGEPTPFVQMRCTWKYVVGGDDSIHITNLEALLQEANVKVDMDMTMSIVGLLGRTIKELTGHNSFMNSLQNPEDAALKATQDMIYYTIPDRIVHIVTATWRPVYIELFHHSSVVVNLEVTATMTLENRVIHCFVYIAIVTSTLKYIRHSVLTLIIMSFDTVPCMVLSGVCWKRIPQCRFNLHG